MQKFKLFCGSGFAGWLFLAVLPLTAQANDATWAAYNRIITVNVGALQQDYTENDPHSLTTGGTLDTERGTLSSVELGARWQAESLPLLLQANARRSNGGTHYDGYQQSGNQLIPYSATTGNIMSDYAVRAGLPIARSDSVQWIPFIEFQQHHWNRNLAQYTENFNHSAELLGVQLQWRQTADITVHPWSIEFEGAAGRMLSANMDASSLNFDQPPGKSGRGYARGETK
jgi:hypothetical protein